MDSFKFSFTYSEASPQFTDVNPSKEELLTFLDGIVTKFDDETVVKPYSNITELKTDIKLIKDGESYPGLPEVKCVPVEIVLPEGSSYLLLLGDKESIKFIKNMDGFEADGPIPGFAVCVGLQVSENYFTGMFAPLSVSGQQLINSTAQFDVELTLYKSSGDTKKEPEAYPSIERSLDKIVDKMEGNMVTIPGSTVEYVVPFKYQYATQEESRVFGAVVPSEYLPSLYGDQVTMQFLNGSTVVNEVLLYRVNDDGISGYATRENVSDPTPPIMTFVDGSSSAPSNVKGIFQANIAATDDQFSFLPETTSQIIAEGFTIKFIDSGKEETVPAYEVFKEAVPSVERSLYKIADLLDIGEEEESSEETVYDDTNVNRYTIKCDKNNITIYDNTGDGVITETTPRVSPSEFIKIVKSNPFCVNRLSAVLGIVETDVTPDLRVLSAFVDSDNRLHLSLNSSLSISKTSGSVYYAFLFTGGEVVINFEAGACDFNGVHMMVSRREGGALTYMGGNNISRR